MRFYCEGHRGPGLLLLTAGAPQLNMSKATSFTLATSAGLPEDVRIRRPPHPTIPTTRTGTAAKATSFTFAVMPGWGSGNDQQTEAGREKDPALPRRNVTRPLLPNATNSRKPFHAWQNCFLACFRIEVKVKGHMGLKRPRNNSSQKI